MKRERFSLIVASYNYEDYLQACLGSLTRQSYDPECFEVICIDDGSTDRSPSVIKDYKRRFSNIVFTRISNSGLENTCNRGIALSRFQRIVRVDADDSIAENFLDRMNQAIQDQPDFDFYYCKQYFEYYSDEEKYKKELPPFEKEEIFNRGDFFATGTVYRKSDLGEVGYFPTQVRNCGLENYSVILALLAKDKRGLAVDGTFFNYRRHHRNMSTLRRDSILQYGRRLLSSYGRSFKTNEYHPYGLKIG